LAVEAVREALRAAQEKEPSRPVVARTRPSNDAAKRLAESVGLSRREDLDEGGFAVFATGWQRIGSGHFGNENIRTRRHR
jgi:RimJ/RimL family protein N-acetyltransferase